MCDRVRCSSVCLFASARGRQSRCKHLHEALVASAAEAQDLPVPLYDRPSHLAVSALLERSVLLRRSARARQQTHRFMVSQSTSPPLAPILFFLFLLFKSSSFNCVNEVQIYNTSEDVGPLPTCHVGVRLCVFAHCIAEL